MHAGRDAHALLEMTVDQRVRAQRLDQVDLGHEQRLGLGARLEMLGPNAEQNFAPVAFLRNQVHRRRADEARDEGGRGTRIDLKRSADLLGAAGIHDDHAVRQGHRFHLIMSHVEAGSSQAPVQGLQLGAHLHPELGVEVGQRLIEQEHRGLAHDRPAHRHPLPLAARELPGLAFKVCLELEDGRRLLHPRVDLLPGEALDAQTIGHVLVDRHVRVERVVLEHHGDIAVLRLEIVDDTRTDRDPAGADALEPGDHAQQRRFAAARGPDNDHELAVGHFGGDAVNHLGVAVALAHVAKRHASHYFSVSTRPFTNQRCISTTTAAGGNSASIAVAITRFHSVSASPPVIMRLMPITAVYIDS